MKLKIPQNMIPIGFLCLYFTTKLLWDSLVPYIFELLSLVLLGYGIIMFFVKDFKKSNVGLVLLYLLLSIYVLFNAFIQDTSQQFNRAIYEYLFYTAIFFAVYYYSKEVEIFKLAKFLYTIGIILAILSWYEYLTKSYIIGSFAKGGNYTTFLSGFRAAVFSRSYLSHGVVLGFFSLVAYYLFICTGKKIYVVSTFLLFISILTTGSRGPLVSTFAALILAYIMNQYRVAKCIDRIVAIWIIIAIIALTVWLFLNSTFTTGNESMDYFLYKIRNIINWTGDAGNVGRIVIWNKSIKLFQSNVWFGIGPSKTGSWGSGSLGVTESGVLKRLCELGITGFVLCYLFIGLQLRNSVRIYKQMEEKREMIFLFSIVIMVLINDLTLQSTEEIMVSFILWFGLGGLAIQILKKKKYHLPFARLRI